MKKLTALILTLTLTLSLTACGGSKKEEAQAGSTETAETENDYRDSGNIKVSSGASIEMVVVKPEKLETVTQIADYLVDRKTILLNLEETNKETARRLIDFLNGVAYAINGDLRKVATNTYVITPSNVELSGEKLTASQETAFTKE